MSAEALPKAINGIIDLVSPPTFNDPAPVDPEILRRRAEAREERRKTHVDPDNLYDRSDMVRQEGMLRAGSIMISAYRVRNPIHRRWSHVQYHFTFDGKITAVMDSVLAGVASNFIGAAVTANGDCFPKEGRTDTVFPVTDAYYLPSDFDMYAYRTRDLESDTWSGLTFQFIRGGMVLAVMGEHSAKLFASFVKRNEDPRRE